MFYSRFYKGFKVEQTSSGWFICNFPNWCRIGPLQSGPYPTYSIAYKVIDRLIKAES